MAIIDHDLYIFGARGIENILRIAKNTAQHYKKITAATTIVFVVLVFSLLIFHHIKMTSKVKPMTAASASLTSLHQPVGMSEQLNDIVYKLSHIEATTDHYTTQTVLKPIEATLRQLQVQLKTTVSQNNTEIIAVMHDDTQKLSQQLATLSSQLQQSQQKKQMAYLKPQDLPFTISHIDNIQSQNIVTVNYNHTTFPLNQGDDLAGWKLIRADFVNQTAELINASGQHVVVTLNQVDLAATVGDSAR